MEENENFEGTDHIPNFDKMHLQNTSLCSRCQYNFSQCPHCKGYFDSLNNHKGNCRYDPSSGDSLSECNNCKLSVKTSDLPTHSKLCETKICLFCNFPFPVNIIKEHQTKCQMDQNQLLLMQTLEKCPYCKEEVPISYFDSHERSCKLMKENKDKIEKELKQVKIELPREWDPMKENSTLELFRLPYNSPEFKFCENLFKRSVKTVKFTKMWRVQNKHLWEKYYREKCKVMKEKGKCEEQFLFHGTRSNSPRVLYTTGFDVSFSSDSGMYGRGIYFARQAVYSYSGYAFNYDKKYYMFIALVQTGMTKVMSSDSSLRKPPFLDRSKYIYYDSVTDADNPKNSYDVSQMFIVYNNDKAYPFYLMEYEQ